MKQINMLDIFNKPEVSRHSFFEYLGSWNSSTYHSGDIQTDEGIALTVKVKLCNDARSALDVVINGVASTYLCGSIGKGLIFRGADLAVMLCDYHHGVDCDLIEKREIECSERRKAEKGSNKMESLRDRQALNRRSKEMLSSK